MRMVLASVPQEELASSLSRLFFEFIFCCIFKSCIVSERPVPVVSKVIRFGVVFDPCGLPFDIQCLFALILDEIAAYRAYPVREIVVLFMVCH